jgi:hypothetical protein
VKYLVVLLFCVGSLAARGTAPGKDTVLTYYLVVNTEDCSSCLNVGVALTKQTFFGSLTYVFREKDRRQAPQVLRELLRVRVNVERIVASDSLYDAFDADHTSFVLLDNRRHPAFQGELRHFASASFQVALAAAQAQVKESATTTRLFADSAIFSPQARILSGINRFWLFDERFQRLFEYSLDRSVPMRPYRRKSWPTKQAHEQYFGDTTKYQYFRRYKSALAKIGKQYLEINHLAVQGDSLYGFITYRFPEPEMTGRDTAVGVRPKVLLCRLSEGRPCDCLRLTSESDSADFFTSFGVGMRRQGRDWIVVAGQYDSIPDQNTPMLARLRPEKGGLRWAGLLPFPKLPRAHHNPALGYNYLSGLFAGRLVFARYDKDIGFVDRPDRRTLPGFAFAKNDFQRLEEPSIQLEILDARLLTPENAREAPTTVRLLIRAAGRYHYAETDGVDGQMRWQRELKLPGGKTTNWTLTSHGNLLGFDPDTNALLAVRLAVPAGSGTE